MLHARQRTDSIHGTIYLSEFESTLTSTPFFIDYMIYIKVPQSI